MRPFGYLAWLLVSHGAVGMKHSVLRLHSRQSSFQSPTVPDVPTYNFTMPVDHFDDSNTQTYNNRFMVNDTYYQVGGPVILHDMGEEGIDPVTAAQFYAEFNGTTSAAMRLAQQLNGLVIGWEHRYYGFSRPVPLDDGAGTPVEGSAGYKYLSVEQALEDVAYFANSLNTTTLNLNTVVSNTTGLDPYHSAWIFLGGSYSGVRAVWSRLKHPEVFYAAWASSAPVQARADGSIYYNPIHQAMPTNCTNDVLAVSEFVDNAITSGDVHLIRHIQASLYIGTVEGATYGLLNQSFSWAPFDIASALSTPFDSYQSFGAHVTTQVFCDYLESYDGQAFLENQTTSMTVAEQVQVALGNLGDAEPTQDGVAATYGDKGGRVAFAAYVYAVYYATQYFNQWEGEALGPYRPFSQQVDTLSWAWQTLDQMGYYQGSNASNPYNMLSKFYNVTSFRELSVEAEFTSFALTDFPSQLNTTGPLSFGGWNIQASNVMFTNGEFDPWRAFGVSSQETAAGAPQRALTQTIPQCNRPPNDTTNVFGLLYGGAVHVEDIGSYSSFHQGSIDTANPPLYQGLDLFVRSYNAWLPCFKQSRDDIRNGKGVDGQGNDASGISISGAGTAMCARSLLWVVLGTVAAMLAST